MLKNIIFDMGNVLIEFDADKLIAEMGIFGADAKRLRNELFAPGRWSGLDDGSKTEDDLIRELIPLIPLRLVEPAMFIIKGWEEPIIEIPGTYELVKELKEQGFGIYLLSNASSRQHEYWPKIRASEFFDGTLISADEKLVKPDPEIYKFLLERFNLKAEECLFIDDVEENVTAAVNVGLKAFRFENNIDELKDYIDSIR